VRFGHPSFDGVNSSTYRDPSVAQRYAGMQTLYAAEERALEKIAPLCRGRPILDLGVGAGRTTPFLLALSEDYLGVDYSPAMVEACRSRFPGVSFEVGDARRLGALADAHFALVVFSFNGIDYVEHSDRLSILGEIWRVLEEGGLFLFSSHNVRYDPRRLQPGLHRMAGRVKDHLVSLRRFGTLCPHAGGNGAGAYRAEREFNGHILLTYYISAEAQCEQLHRAGFDCDGIFSHDGDAIAPATIERTPSPWLYYLARKSHHAV